mmetsp:Transcript_12859/g.19692  ORF Transcript_12859/g.19692 Transcript_12859/m.19692 type:complete len:610 (-) Transcript_12859:2461-4290(-)|eukprot:CAMPEP_0178937586 /NCGR_PEP_ID=MMETSP0786-20121207/25847_1 /TAXON_ID=186022 /ORGANISM="Thalassionema frauenfeldii, Strain CCMP 1798" /LENGTH=609 /DNA_ID=CAMNT_0020616189 /DNA_START=550 /DNA_END=2379 /DNA_ORIENTATION=+
MKMETYPMKSAGPQTVPSLVTPASSSTSSISENTSGVGCGKNDISEGLPTTNSNQTQNLEAPSGNQELPGDNSTPHHPIAEFLYQLTKMLTDDNNEIIEWADGKIKVHHPDRLEGEILQKYFRHSKFASFQRQLNYFGFRKIAGKGKMSPCSYVNDAATSDIRSLLLIKRKTNGSAARKAAMAQRAAAAAGVLQTPMTMGQYASLPVPSDYFKQALASGMAPSLTQSGFYPGAMIADVHQQAALQHQAALGQQAALQQGAFHGVTQQQKPLGESLYLPSHNTLAALAQGQRRIPPQDLGGYSKKPGITGSLEQLQQLSAANSALNLAGFGMIQPSSSVVNAPPGSAKKENDATRTSTSAAQPPAVSTPMPATEAMNATAAANAAASSQSNNLFESSTALSALVGNNSSNPQKDDKAQLSTSSTGATAIGSASNALATQNRLSNSNLLRGLPSTGAMFPDTLSTVSLQGLLPGVAGMSSNRLSSMLSLSGFLSRDPSMADLLPGASNANLAGLTAAAPLGNTTLVPLTGSVSQLTNSQLGGQAHAYLGALAAGGVHSLNPGPAPTAATVQQATSGHLGTSTTPAGSSTVGVEPTPIIDMNARPKFPAPTN